MFNNSIIYNQFKPNISYIQNVDWLKWQEIWMDNPLITVDANQIESMVIDMHKAMSRCVKIFQENPSRSIFCLKFIEFGIHYICNL